MPDDPDVEFLDVGPPDDVRPRVARRGRRRWWPVVVLAAVVLGLIGFAVVRGSGGSTSAHDPNSSQPAIHTGGPPPRLSSVAALPPQTRVLGHPLLGETGGWELIARGPNLLVRIEPGLGRVVTTQLPSLDSTGDASLVTGPNQVLIRPLDYVEGYTVPDGRQPDTMPRTLSRGPIFPGPLPNQVWAPSGDGMQLFDVDGQAVGEPMALPSGRSELMLMADGQGGLAFSGVGGYYRLHPSGWERFTTGVPLALGPTRTLVQECDARYDCHDVVIDADTGIRRGVAARLPNDRVAGLGAISPNGRYAAIPFADTDDDSAFRLLDLDTGTVRQTALTVDMGAVSATTSGSIVVWSPDSRWLFGISDGGVQAVNARTGREEGLGVSLPSVIQLAVRPNSD